MNNQVRKILVKLVSSFGTSVIGQPQRLRGLLNDECPGCKREINVLVIAAEQKLVAQLQGSVSTPWETVSGRLVRRLMDDAGIAEDAALWAVESWALALGRVVPVTVGPVTRGGPHPRKPKPGDKASQPGQASKSTQVANHGTTAAGPKIPPKTQRKRSWLKTIASVVILGVFFIIRLYSSGGNNPKKPQFTPKLPPAPAITYQWDFTIRDFFWERDDIWLKNTSAVTISNVEFTVNIATDDRAWNPIVLKAPGIWPGQTYTWPNVVNIPGGRFDRNATSGNLSCDQMKGPQ